MAGIYVVAVDALVAVAIVVALAILGAVMTGRMLLPAYITEFISYLGKLR